MGLKTFEFQSIEDIDDGSIALALNQALRAAFLDCDDRPELKKPRKVGFEVSMSPVMDKGELRYVQVGFEIKKAFPSQGVVVVMKPGGDGLEFQPAISDNPDQKPLEFEGK